MQQRRKNLDTASGLVVSYINQDTSFLNGSLDSYIDRIAATFYYLMPTDGG